jgi:NTE family protein
MTKRALVISGGEAKGAFAVGAIQVLAEHGITFDVVCGTSTGALIAPFVVTSGHLPGELALLEQLYTSVETPDVITQRPLVASLLRGAAVADATPLRRLIASVITPERWEIMRDSAVQMFVAAVRLQTGRIEYFQSGREKSQAPGVNVIDSREELINAVWASACEPVLMPPVTIYAGRPQAQYVDGGLCQYLPAGIAIDHGADEIYAITLRPHVRAVQQREYTELPSILIRTLELLTAEVGDKNLAMTDLYTNAVRYLAAVRAGVRERFALSEEEAAALFTPAGLPDPFADKRAAHLVVIAPEGPLVEPGSMSGLDPASMAVMLQKGRAQARRVLGTTS